MKITKKDMMIYILNHDEEFILNKKYTIDDIKYHISIMKLILILHI